MRLLDLFAGIGGFSLAAHWLGWQTAAFVEKDKFCQRVLQKNFPGVPIHDDIITVDGSGYRGSVDIISGGFPCQPFSQAGKQKGTDDDRHLFPQMLRVVAEVRPRWVVAENVRGLLSIANGDVFEEVAASLESEDYEVQAFCIPASAVDGPHRRDRIWIVAHSADADGQRCLGRCEQSHAKDERRVAVKDQRNVVHALPNTIQRLGTEQNGQRPAGLRHRENIGWSENWLEAATRLCRVDDVVPDRVDRLKALGNAVVPLLVYEIFQAIEHADKV